VCEDCVRVLLLVIGEWFACPGIIWPGGAVTLARCTGGLRRWWRPCG
jgi:hypothetical protein